MKKEVMTRAWEIRKDWHSRRLTFGECLKRAWKEIKEKYAFIKLQGIKFVNNMTLTVDGYERTLTRWTKGNLDRVYINGGSSNGDGFVDLKTGDFNLRGGLSYQKKIASLILKMVF